jgi:hypothetical protein
MPTANSIITPQVPKAWKAVCTAAETAFHAPTQAQVLVDETVDTTAHRITSLYAVARAAVGAACHCQLYWKVGTAYTLIDSVLMAAATPSGSVASPKADFGYSEDNPLILPAGVGLAVAIGQAVANGVAFRAQGGGY